MTHTLVIAECGSLAWNVPAEQRFWARVRKYEGCWMWTGSKNGRGYGWLRVNGVVIRAHRYSYELHHGAIPSDKVVCHWCDTPLCVNPDHLYAETQQHNVADAGRKGKMSRKGEAHPLHKLTDDGVRTIRLRAANGERGADLAREYGITRTMAYYIIDRRCWRHVV